ncbi:hypothetical protein LQ318_06985 [Aliifodinibius salicampi]|uniref:P pilus assembly protein, chaperone PapD n=1 Tax=Fodinibius salicampi TaxID=1920655 RepID=A0ABT3PXS5_9BACT|nr:hypothetical protein [Fodinibius salicampi]MCW9712644.1 hypothetical protein [Fodinibius salicampi]
MKKTAVTSIILFLSVLACEVQAQITIAPTMVFIDQQNRFGNFLVLNGSDQAQEVSIEFPFGYPATNAEGEVQMIYDDSTKAEQFGISNLVKGFPQSFVLQPGQRQVVRLTVRPKDFSDGTYWTRIKVTSNAQNPPIGEETDDEITAQITYKFEQITTLFYKHGETNTGIKINDFTHRKSDNSITFLADVSRSGNSPFLGSINLNILDSEGNTLLTRSAATSIYFDYRQTFDIPKDSLDEEEYTAEISFESQRPDVARENIIQMEPVSNSISFSRE